MRKPMPRDAAGAIEIKDGTGPIRAMLSTGDRFFIYKTDKTFRVETPETIDPNRTNPNAPFVVSEVEDIGCGNWIVARVLLQSDEILNSGSFTSEAAKTSIRKQLCKCKDALVQCERVITRLQAKIREIERVLIQAGLQITGGRVVTRFPHVEDLELDCSTFLIEANRAIKAICALPRLFIKLGGSDSNFDRLCKRLEKRIEEHAPLTDFVRSVAAPARRLVDMRNFLEHPGDRRTVINDLRFLPDGAIAFPTWCLSGENEVSILEDMLAALGFLVSVSEKMVIHLFMYEGKKHFQSALGEKHFEFGVQEVPDEQVDPSFPIKYKFLAYFKPSASKQ